MPDFPSVVEMLREEGLVRPAQAEPTEPFDITRDAIRFPAPRSARLQAMARGETGFIVAMGYSAQRGYGAGHPTIAELRSGELPIQIQHPLTHDPVTLGAVSLTEVEAINHTSGGMGATIVSGDEAPRRALRPRLRRLLRAARAQGDRHGDHRCQHEHPRQRGPAADEEFVLMHCDALESSGFVEHIKLPHYVTFQSTLDRVRFRRLAQLSAERGTRSRDIRGRGTEELSMAS